MTQEEQYKSTLSRYLPASAVDAVYQFLNGHAVHLHITRKRDSKLGDYRMPQPRHEYHEISINGDLSPHMFLLVLLHEMAHLETFLHHGRSVQPHGHEWQQNYRSLLVDYANAGHFPVETLPLLKKYTAKIPLNRNLGSELERQLRQTDSPDTALSELLLKDLPVGSRFRIKSRPQHLFQSVEKRRTRYRCIDMDTHIPYLISGSMPIVGTDGDPINDDLAGSH